MLDTQGHVLHLKSLHTHRPNHNDMSGYIIIQFQRGRPQMASFPQIY